MEDEEKEIWHRLENESERAYQAFESYRNLPSGERTLIEAYRQRVGNPEATKPSDTWTRWSHDFAWKERAAAYDAHIDRLREKSTEDAIQREAEERARQVEQMSGRRNELMTVAYERAIEHLESEDFVQQMRPQDVINILKLHFEVVEKLGGFTPPQEIAAWTEEEQAEFDRIVEEIDAEEAQEQPEEGSDEGEVDSEDGEGDAD